MNYLTSLSNPRQHAPLLFWMGYLNSPWPVSGPCTFTGALSLPPHLAHRAGISVTENPLRLPMPAEGLLSNVDASWLPLIQMFNTSSYPGMYRVMLPYGCFLDFMRPARPFQKPYCVPPLSTATANNPEQKAFHAVTPSWVHAFKNFDPEARVNPTTGLPERNIDGTIPADMSLDVYRDTTNTEATYSLWKQMENVRMSSGLWTTPPSDFSFTEFIPPEIHYIGEATGIGSYLTTSVVGPSSRFLEHYGCTPSDISKLSTGMPAYEAEVRTAAAYCLLFIVGSMSRPRHAPRVLFWPELQRAMTEPEPEAATRPLIDTALTRLSGGQIVPTPFVHPTYNFAPPERKKPVNLQMLANLLVRENESLNDTVKLFKLFGEYRGAMMSNGNTDEWLDWLYDPTRTYDDAVRTLKETFGDQT
jgi:hypothetical protein